MISFLVSTTLMIASYAQLVATETAQSYWTVPNGNQPDFSQTFTNGMTLPIAWNGWDAGWTDNFLDGSTVANLWVTSYNYEAYQYTQELTKGINISLDGSYTWTINVTATTLANTAEYVLRFMRPYDTYNETGLQLSSRGFIILPAAGTTTTSSVMSFTTTTSSVMSTTSSVMSFTTTSSQTTTTANPTSTSVMTTPTSSPLLPAASTTSAPVSAGLSTGAKAGVGVGSAVGGVALFGILWLAFRRRYTQKKPTPASQTSGSHGYYKEPKPLYPQELPAYSEPVELYSQVRSR